MKKAGIAIGTAAVAATVGLAGCQSVATAAGVTKVTPDEFKVVTKAPLVIPPEYALRPPNAGESTPIEVARSSRGERLLFGQDTGVGSTEGEQLLIAKAGATATDPSIRSVVDYEEAGIVRKNQTFVNRVIGFGRSDDETEANPIDADAEADRLAREQSVDAATGGGRVTIERGSTGNRIKLPGT